MYSLIDCYQLLLLFSQLSDQINSQLNSMIVKYRDDIDLQNVIDWIQSDWVSSIAASSSCSALCKYI